MAILLFLRLATCLCDKQLRVGARASLVAQMMSSIETALFSGCGDGYSHFGPESEFILSALFQTFGDEFDAGNDFFEENLEDRVRPREPSTHVPTRCQQILVLDLESLLLGLANEGGPLLGQNLVIRSQDEVDIVLKL